MSASMPSAAGVAPASTKSPAAAISPPAMATSAIPSPWLIQKMAATMAIPPTIPIDMIVVRLKRLKRFPQ
jgi:hypothetical protein